MAATMEFPPDFELFWYKYPRRYVESSGTYVKVGKYKAYQVWAKMSKSDRIAATEALSNLPSSATWIKDAFRWLRDKGWLDIELKPPQKRTTFAPVAKSTPAPAQTTPPAKNAAIIALKQAAAQGNIFAKLQLLKKQDKQTDNPVKETENECQTDSGTGFKTAKI